MLNYLKRYFLFKGLPIFKAAFLTPSYLFVNFWKVGNLIKTLPFQAL